MKLLSLFAFLFFSISSFSQISVGARHMGASWPLDKETLGKFKNTETIFVLSESLDRGQYFKILQDSWKVTPYQIVHGADFKIDKYINGNYSIAQLSGYNETVTYGIGGGTSLMVFIDLTLPDHEKIAQKKERLSEEKWEEKKYNIIDANSDKIARIYLHPKGEFIQLSMRNSMEKTFVSLYTDDVFYDYKPGFLKNYLQKVSNLLEDEEHYWMFKKDYSPELKNLSKKTLYVPSYMGIQYNGWIAKDSERDNENIVELFKKYDFPYEVIDDQALSEKIMNKEDLYYIRFIRVTTKRFIQIVDAKSGEVLYRDYIGGLGYKIKPKNIKDINKRIKKLAKK